MTLVKNGKQNYSEGLSLESFEETYKTAYSHGLEAIYSLENVDIKTVRKIEKNSPVTEPVAVEERVDLSDQQQEFDFGEQFRDWIEPIFLREPIYVLGLSFQAEACLLEHGLARVSDLLTQNFRDLVFLKGMGQGHIDEIQKKLDHFIAGRPLDKGETIDFKSLILSLSDGIKFKKLSLFLEEYGLADIVPLTQAEKIELKAFDMSKGEGWQEEVLEVFNQESCQKEMEQILQQMAWSFLIPWMDSRNGLATKEELVERLEKISEEPRKVESYLAFIQENFTEGCFPFTSYLFQGSENVFCSTTNVANSYLQVVQKAKSYFYRPHVRYPFDQLVYYLMREFVKEWKDMTQEFIEACLKRSPSFQVVLDSQRRRLITPRL